MHVTVSAPGKIHLLGEHAVVYGRPALLAAIDKRVYVEIRNPKSDPSTTLRTRIRNNEKIIIHTTEKDDVVKHAIREFKKAFHIEKLPPLAITITSQLPAGSGLGSSAAVTAAVLGALLKYVKNLWNPTRINELTFELEKIAHGNPSGADNSTVVFGGLVWFRREFDFLKSIWSLPITQYKIPNFYLIDTGRPEESTKDMVDLVRRNYDGNTKKMEDIFSDQEIQTKKIVLGLKKGDEREVGEAMIRGEENLEKIGVVSVFAQKVTQRLKEEKIAAKICGAGGKKKGSGMVLCLTNSKEKVKKIADSLRLSYYPITLGEEGVRIEGLKQ